jgi:CRISPR-associated endonuclease/helicase Cas3
LKNHNESTLIIVNTKAVAKELVCELRDKKIKVLHLSTNMCSAHRQSMITLMRCKLRSKEPFICVSTQLIEAGVDISFECVVRDLAGLDSIYQAAGRCNRHGEYGEIKNVYIVNITGENLDKLPDIKKGAEITRRLFDDNNLDIDEYYKYYFYAQKDKMDYSTGGGSGSVYDLLTCNQQGRENFNNNGNTEVPCILSAIHSAAEEFYVIERGKTDVIVPYSDSSKLLDSYIATYITSEKRKLLRELGKYSVSLYAFQLNDLWAHGGLTERDGIYVLNNGFYDKLIGVNLDGSNEFLCV